MLEDQYYSTEDVLNRNIRNGLLHAIKNLTAEAFGEVIQSFSLGEYTIIMTSKAVDLPNLKEKPTILMYSIVDTKTDEKVVTKAMETVLSQFLNRYSWNDIQALKIKKFKKFKPRLEKIFGDLILRSEDRFKSLF